MAAVSLQSIWEHPIKSINTQVIALPIKEGYRLVEQEDILYCKAEGNYTKIYFINESSILISRKLKVIAANLENSCFLRIHQSYLVNMRQARFYLRKSGGQLVMKNGENLPISKTFKQQVLQHFKII